MSSSHTTTPNLDDYDTIRVEDLHGCDGCVFDRMDKVDCRKIPCCPTALRPWHVIYKDLPKSTFNDLMSMSSGIFKRIIALRKEANDLEIMYNNILTKMYSD